MNEQKVEVVTPVGTLVATPTGGGEYPGIQIELRKDGISYDLGLAVIEYNGDMKTLRAHVWSNAMHEDPTIQATYDNVDAFFENDAAERTTYSLVNVAREYESPDGRVLVDGSWLQHSCRGFAGAVLAARMTEAANGNKIKIAVVPEIPGSGISLYGPHTGLERLDAGPSFQTPAERKNIR